MPSLPDQASDEPISVLMPVRNGARHLTQSLGDILSSIRLNDEVLVIDDGSQDDTPTLLATLQEQDARLRVIRLPPTGLVGALNVGILESAHEWIARADADDRYPASRFDAQRRARRPGRVLIAGDYSIVGLSGPLGTIPCALGHPFVALSVLHPQRIPHPGVMLSRSATLEAGAYVPAEFPAEDLGLWLRLMTMGQFVGVPVSVVEWHLAPGTTSATRQESQRAITGHLLSMFPDSVVRSVSEEAIHNELGLYANAQMQGERTVLLLRDLITARSRGANIPRGLLARIAAAGPVRNLAATGVLAVEMLKRRRWRLAAR